MIHVNLNLFEDIKDRINIESTEYPNIYDYICVSHSGLFYNNIIEHFELL